MADLADVAKSLGLAPEVRADECPSSVAAGGGEWLTVDVAPQGKRGDAVVTVAIGGASLIVDKFNVFMKAKREALVNAIAEARPEVDVEGLRRLLLSHASRLAAGTPGDAPAAGTAPPVAPIVIDDDLRAEAEALLEAPDLLQRIVRDLGTVGVAGEQELAATLFLVGTSRLLDRPLACIVQGPSSSGKSYTIERVATLFPPEAVIHATQMTPQALFHMPAGSLAHRWIVAGERSRLENDEAAEASRALREMISAGRLSKLMPIKTNDGIVTKPIEQEGPIAFCESTTLGDIFDEDLNRCLLLTTDERPAQTKRILQRLAAGYARGATAADLEPLVARHHALQRLLEPVAIVVPFAEWLAEHFTSERVEARRAFPQLVSLIQASALLHQRQRPRDDLGRVLAAVDDYALASRLLAGPFGRTLGGGIGEPTRRWLERAGRKFGGQTFTTTAAIDAERKSASPRAVRGWIADATAAGAVEQVEPPRGSVPATWRLTGATPAPSTILPTVEALQTALPTCRQAVNQDAA